MEPLIETAHTQLNVRRERLLTALSAAESEHLERLLTDVDRALAALEEGTWDSCSVCHESIERERLAADPLVRVCLDCLTPEEGRALEHDLETAASVQATLLPPAHQRFRDWEIHFEYRPLGAVSGDHCDVIVPDGSNDRLYFLFGDVAGKGLAASLLMSHLHALFRSLTTLDLPLVEIVARANRLFYDSTSANAYATLIVGRLNGRDGISLVNLGHCPPLVARRDGVETLATTSLPFGMFCDGSFETQQLELGGGDSLFLYTDGLTEATNEAGEEYGSDRIASVVRRARSGSAEEITRACLADLAAFSNDRPRADDLSLMVISRDGAS